MKDLNGMRLEECAFTKDTVLDVNSNCFIRIGQVWYSSVRKLDFGHISGLLCVLEGVRLVGDWWSSGKENRDFRCDFEDLVLDEVATVRLGTSSRTGRAIFARGRCRILIDTLDGPLEKCGNLCWNGIGSPAACISVHWKLRQSKTNCESMTMVRKCEPKWLSVCTYVLVWDDGGGGDVGGGGGGGGVSKTVWKIRPSTCWKFSAGSMGTGHSQEDLSVHHWVQHIYKVFSTAQIYQLLSSKHVLYFQTKTTTLFS